MVESVKYRNLINVYNCHPGKLAEVSSVQNGLEQVLADIKNETKDFFYQFTPEGVTGMYLWSNGHFCIHTWPEQQMAAMDLVGYPHNPHTILQKLNTTFPARYVSIGENIKLSKRNKRVGQEVVGTLSNIDLPNIFNREENVLDLLKYISKKSNFNVIGQISRSDHENIDAAVILSESHFSIHYNQQTNEVKVDIFTCGKEGDPNKGYELLKNEIRAQESNRIYLKR